MKLRRCCSAKCQNISAGLGIGLGVVLLVAGIAMYSTMDQIVRLGVSQQVPLMPDAWSTGVWMDPKFEVEMAFWFFNFTNVREFLSGTDAKPKLTQVGPYKFREIQSKSQILPHWSDNNNRIFYYNNHTYIWKDGNIDDVIWHLNVPLITVINTVDDMLKQFAHIPEIHELLDFAIMSIDKSEGYVKKTVREMLYDGYEDHLFTLLGNVSSACNKLDWIPGIAKICGSIPAVPGKMGFFYGKNATADGTYYIDSGKKDAGKTGIIYEWNGSSNLSYWKTPWTNMLNGTDGTLNPPFTDRHDEFGQPTHLPLFVSDICRSLYVEYAEDTDVAIDSSRSIPGFLFKVPAAVFSATLPDNDGFCIPTMKFYHASPSVPFGDTSDLDKRYCLPDGMLDLSPCQFGAPVVVSSPHFMFCPDEVFDSVEGLVKNDVDHETTIIVEPTVGIGMYFARKLQLNVALKNVTRQQGGSGPYDKIQSAKVIPVLWLNESGVMDNGTGNDLYTQVIGQQQLLHILTYLLMAGGPLLIILCLLWLGCRRWRQTKGEKSRL